VIYASAAEVVAHFERQHAEVLEKFLHTFPSEKYPARVKRRAAARMKVQLGKRPCLKGTPARIYDAKTKLKETARDLPSLDPVKIIAAVAMHLQLDPLTIARLWPEIARELGRK
jgi:hypothetical protein